MPFNQMLHCVQHDSLALMSFPLPLLEGVPAGRGRPFPSPSIGGSARRGGRLFPLPHYGGSARRGGRPFLSLIMEGVPAGEGGLLYTLH